MDELIVKDANNRINEINLINAGYITDYCCMTRNMMFSIILHCVENYRLFNEEQQINIKNIINSFNVDCHG